MTTHSTAKTDSAAKIKVYDPKELYEALFPYSENDQYLLNEQGSPQTDEYGKKITKPVKHEILILRKKEVYGGTKKSNCEYLSVSVKLPSDEVPNPLILRISNILVTKPPIDYNDPNDIRNNFEKSEKRMDPTHNVIETKRDEAGYYGMCIEKLNEAWLYKIEQMRKKKEIIVNANKKVCPLLQLEYSDKAGNLAGQPINNPPIRFKVDFTKYPGTYSRSFMRNKPKSTINDWSRRITAITKDGKQKEVAPQAIICNDNGTKEELTIFNIYKFVTKGSTIVYGRVHIESAIISSLGISMPQLLGMADIEPGSNEGGFEGEEDIDTAAMASMSIQSVTNSTNNPIVSNNSKEEAVENDKDSEVLEFLDSV